MLFASVHIETRLAAVVARQTSSLSVSFGLSFSQTFRELNSSVVLAPPCSTQRSARRLSQALRFLSSPRFNWAQLRVPSGCLFCCEPAHLQHESWLTSRKRWIWRNQSGKGRATFHLWLSAVWRCFSPLRTPLLGKFFKSFVQVLTYLWFVVCFI